MSTLIVAFTGVFCLAVFIIGVQAGVRGFKHRGSYGMTLGFLALNLCEPLINTALISALVISIGLDHITRLLPVTLPMAVLLLPALGLLLPDPRYRRICGRIFLLGLGRWILTVLIFLVAFKGGLALFVPLLVAGFGLLAFSGWWGQRQLQGSLAESHSAALGFSPQQAQ